MERPHEGAFALAANELGAPRLGSRDVTAAPSGGQGLALNDKGYVPGSPPAPLSFTAGWGNFSSTVQGGQFWKDLTGMVYLRGIVTKSGGTPGANDVIATLPVGCWPALREVFVVSSGVSETHGRVDVRDDGTITWQAGGTSETDYVSLSGISFLAKV